MDRRIGVEGWGSFGLILSHIWAPLISVGITLIHLNALGVTWMHLDSLGPIWIHLGSLALGRGLLWIVLARDCS